jgi:UDP-N-acetylmuramate dehydrogenase
LQDRNPGGIPGSLGGAVYGNAGAYGHAIAERIRTVRFFDGEKVRTIDRVGCGFAYRDSIFKRRGDWNPFSPLNST